MKDSWREIELGNTHFEFGDNTLKSARFTLLKFLPSFLISKSRRTLNLWFALTSVLQLVFSNLHEWEPWTTLVFFASIVVLSLVKEFAAEVLKILGDSSANKDLVSVWSETYFNEVKARDLRVGQFIRLQEGDELPADLVLLSTSRKDYKCFVNLTKLTGKKDPSEKTALPELAIIAENFESDHSVIQRIEGTVEVVLPSPDIDMFEGSLKLRGFPRGVKLKVNQFLPRGAILTNTAWVLGVVVYVGKDTKFLLNNEDSAEKLSKLDAFSNKASSVAILGAILLSLICAGIAATEMRRSDEDYNFGEYLIGFLITYQRVVPLTLYVLLDFARLICKLSLSSACKVNNSTVLDNLGLVEYVLTGKAGSVTTGRSSLKVCLIANNEYWNERPQKSDVEEFEDGTKILVGTSSSYNGATVNPIEAMLADYSEEGMHLVLAMLLCCSSSTNKSPFESCNSRAIIEGMLGYGYSLEAQDPDRVFITAYAKSRDFQLVFSFISEGLTYIVVRDAFENTCWLYVQGEVNCVEKFFRQSEDDLNRLEQLLKFSKNKGLHVTVFAYKQLTIEQANELKLKNDCAKAGVVNQDGRIKDALEEIVSGLAMLGSVGLQEDLVPGVSNTLDALSKAGAKVWLVSSEDEESVVSSGMNLGLITPTSNVLVLTNIDSQFHLKRTLIKAIRRFIFDAEGLPMSSQNTLENDAFTPKPLNKLLDFAIKIPGKSRIYKSLSIKGDNIYDILEEPYDPFEVEFCVILDGMTFNTAVRDKECRMLLTCCLFPSTSVLAHGFMPLQKAELVRLLQSSLVFKPVILAIGEGERDGPMMRQADIGVSLDNSHNSDTDSRLLTKQKGLPRADIYLNDFESLSWLVNVKGRQFSAGLTRMICLSLYKNLSFTLTLVYYNFMCDFSGTQLYTSLLAAGFDLLFTVLPLIVVALDKVSSGVKISRRLAGKYGLMAAGHSAIVFLYVAAVADQVLDKQGGVTTVASFGLTIYASLLLAFYLQVMIEIESSYILAASTCFISAGSMFACLVYAYPADFAVVTSSPSSLIGLFCAPLSCGSASLIIQALARPSGLAKVEPLQTNKPRLSAYKDNLLTVFSKSRGWKSDNAAEALVLDSIRLTFTSPSTESAYNISKITASVAQSRMFMLAAAPLFGCWLIVIYFAQGLPLSFAIFRACIVGFLLATWASTYSSLALHHRTSATVFCVCGLVLVFAFVLLEKSVTDIGFALACVFIPLVFFVSFLTVVVEVVVSLCLAQVAQSALTSYSNPTETSTLFLYQFCVLLAIGIVSVAGGYSIEKNSRERFKLNQIMSLEVEKSQTILGFLLPAFVKDRVREGARYISEDQGTVSILFCDIYDFDRICAEYSPKELTDFLDSLFGKFDFLCDAHGVTKIETVGKTYMACAGLRDSEADLPMKFLSRSHARRVTDMALDIVRTCSTRILKYGEPLRVKIGLNSGPVTAGVVGYHKPQFSLVGDTVNTASRMCSTLSQTNGIQMTAYTYDLLGNKDGLAFTLSSVEAKGKGLLETKLVTEDLLVRSQTLGNLRLSNTVSRRTIRSSISGDLQLLRPKGTEAVNDIITFTCRDTKKQAEFRASFIQRHLVLIKLGLFVGFALNLSLAILELVQLIELHNFSTPAIVACRACVTLGYFVVWLLPWKFCIKAQFRLATTALAIANTVATFINLIENTQEPHSLVLVEAMFVVVFFSNCSGCYFMQIVPVNAAILLLWVFLSPWVSDGLDFAGQSICLFLVVIVNLWVTYRREASSRDFANLLISSQKEIERTEKLVTQMMPARVYDNLKNDRELTEKLIGVSLLFADIVGFTAWSSDKQPTEVVGMLSELFNRFDRMAVEYGVYKVHTIGDCYVVMSDTNFGARNPSHEVKTMVEFAFSMLEEIRQINEEHKSQLNMRLGVHFGDIIAGITGTNIVRYDIYGPDVLIANKMESGGQAGRLNISDVARELIMQAHPDDFDFEFNTEIQAKSINRKHNSFFVARRNAEV